VLATGPSIEDICTIVLEAPGATVPINQQWVFQANGTIKSGNGFTLAIDSFEGGAIKNQLIGYLNVATPDNSEIFRIVPAV